MVWIVVALGCVVAGVVQAVTGFGSVVFMMMVFPFFFDMIDAPAWNTATTMRIHASGECFHACLHKHMSNNVILKCWDV